MFFICQTSFQQFDILICFQDSPFNPPLKYWSWRIDSLPFSEFFDHLRHGKLSLVQQQLSSKRIFSLTKWSEASGRSETTQVAGNPLQWRNIVHGLWLDKRCFSDLENVVRSSGWPERISSVQKFTTWLFSAYISACLWEMNLSCTWSQLPAMPETWAFIRRGEVNKGIVIGRCVAIFTPFISNRGNIDLASSVISNYIIIPFISKPKRKFSWVYTYYSIFISFCIVFQYCARLWWRNIGQLRFFKSRQISRIVRKFTHACRVEVTQVRNPHY